jgi:hypothetical protein
MEALVEWVIKEIERRFYVTGEESNVISLANRIQIQWRKWPNNEPWRTIFDRLLLNTEDRFELSETVDILMEMLNLDKDRSGTHGIVTLAYIPTFSVLFDVKNDVIREYFVHLQDKSLASALKAWGGEQVTQHIYSTMFTTASNMIRLETERRRWPSEDFTDVSSYEELYSQLDRHSEQSIVVCDNVTANDILARKPQALKLHLEKLDYPNPMPIGLGFDVTDREWGLVLQAAMEKVVVDSREEVKASLASFVRALEQIDGVPAGALQSRYQEVADGIA